MLNEKNDISHKTLDGRTELPLTTIKLSFKPHVVTTPAFIGVDGEAAACISTRFSSIQAIEKYLEEQHRVGREVYLYELYGQMVEYPGGTPPKQLTYTLRYSIRIGHNG